MFMSTAPPGVEGTKRLVLTSVSVRTPLSGLRPRKSAIEAPTLYCTVLAVRPVLVSVDLETFCGSVWIVSAMLTWPIWAIWSAPITVTGVGELNVDRATREPVTMMDSVSLRPCCGDSLCA